MKVSTKKELEIANRLCEIINTDYLKFCRISQLLIRRVARRQQKIMIEKNWFKQQKNWFL